MRVLDAEAMRGVDRRAIEELGIPSLVLMENAAIGVVDAVAEAYPAAERVLVLCGPGNNGGDGLAVARHLDVRGYDVLAALVLGGRELGGDAAEQLSICRSMQLAISEVDSREALFELDWDVDLVIDGLFGTGLTRPLADLFATTVEAISRSAADVIAVDLPSGLDASTSAPIGPHAEADLTVTFAAPKVAHILPPACHAVGEVVVTDLGVPPRLVEEAPGDLRWLDAWSVAPLVRPRPIDGHKGTFGHLLVVAGGPGTCGAAILAARGGLRAGAGLVTVAVPDRWLGTVDGASLESMTHGCPSTPEGRIAEDALGGLLEAASARSAVVVGPGVGRDPSTESAIRGLVLGTDRPLVLDADGLNAFEGTIDRLGERDPVTVLTPHPGELGRLLGRSTADVVADRVGSVREAAARSGAVVVLKGFRTLVAVPEGEIGIASTGHDALATGGTGDVLAGLIGGLLAQGVSASSAAAVGTHVHGLAGELAAEAIGSASVVAGDVADQIGPSLVRLHATS